MVIKTSKVTIPLSGAGVYPTLTITDAAVTTSGKAVVTPAQLKGMTDTRGQMEFYCEVSTGQIKITGEKPQLIDNTDLFVMYDTDGTGADLGGGGGGSMVYPGVGIGLSTGAAWDTSITDNSADWNTAFGWGDHSGAGYLLTETDPVYSANTYAVAMDQNVDSAATPTFGTVAINTVLPNATTNIGIGTSSSATGGDALAFGNGTTASGISGVALGINAGAIGDYSLCFGVNTGASGTNDVTIGKFCSTSAGNTVAIGYSSVANANDSIAIGNTATASAADVIAIGSSSAGTDAGEILIGKTTAGIGTNSIFIGTSANATVTGNNSICIGYSSSTKSDHSVSIGVSSVVGEEAASAIAIGQDSSAGNGYSVAIGKSASAAGGSSIAIGDTASASASNSVAIGKTMTTAVADTMVLGTNGTARITIKGDTGIVTINDILHMTARAEPASGTAGDVYYDSTSNKLRFYNGSAWGDV